MDKRDNSNLFFIVELVKRAKKIRREEGWIELIRRSYRYGLNRYRMWRSPYHVWNRTDSEARWGSIQDNIASSDGCAIDIGSASGFFTEKLSKEGLFAIGIEADEKRLSESRALYGEKEGLAFSRYNVGPDNIEDLPSMDVCLLLTVYHHWTAHYGSEDAEYMLQSLSVKMDKIFFELPKDLEKNGMFETNLELNSNQDLKTQHIKFIEKILPGSQVNFIHEADYPFVEDRKDLMFLIDCSNINSMSQF